MSEAVKYLVNSQPEFRKARLPSLYSDFRAQGRSNPDGYQANVIAWESGLTSMAKAGLLGNDKLSIRFGSKLERLLQLKDHGQPQGLKIVEEETVLNGQLLPLSEFFSSTESIYNENWDVNPTQLPLKALKWVLRQTGLTDRVQADPNRHYVLLCNLEEAGERLLTSLTQVKGRVDRVLPITMFREFVVENLSLDTLSDIDFATILKWLSRDKHHIAYNESMVKIKEPMVSAVEISQNDMRIAALKTIILDIQSQIDSVSNKIDDRDADVKKSLARKNRTYALTALKSRKLLEQVLVERGRSLAQLEGVLNKIQEASDQIEVVNAMQGSTEILRMLSKETGSIDHVEKILEELNDEIVKVDEVKNAFNDQAQLASDIDEKAVDAELSQLEAESRQQESTKEVEKRLEQLSTFESLKRTEKAQDLGIAKVEAALSS